MYSNNPVQLVLLFQFCKENEAQRGWKTCPKSHSNNWQSQNPQFTVSFLLYLRCTFYSSWMSMTYAHLNTNFFKNKFFIEIFLMPWWLRLCLYTAIITEVRITEWYPWSQKHCLPTDGWFPLTLLSQLPPLSPIPLITSFWCSTSASKPLSFAMCPLLNYRKSWGCQVKPDNIANESAISRFWSMWSFHASFLHWVEIDEMAIFVSQKWQFHTVQPNNRAYRPWDVHFLWCPWGFSSIYFMAVLQIIKAAMGLLPGKWAKI